MRRFSSPTEQGNRCLDVGGEVDGSDRKPAELPGQHFSYTGDPVARTGLKMWRRKRDERCGIWGAHVSYQNLGGVSKQIRGKKEKFEVTRKMLPKNE